RTQYCRSTLYFRPSTFSRSAVPSTLHCVIRILSREFPVARMSKKTVPALVRFPELLAEIKLRIQQSQARAVLAVNAELIRLYWDIGRMIDGRQQQAGWGAGVIPRLARELRDELA